MNKYLTNWSYITKNLFLYKNLPSGITSLISIKIPQTVDPKAITGLLPIRVVNGAPVTIAKDSQIPNNIIYENGFDLKINRN